MLGLLGLAVLGGFALLRAGQASQIDVNRSALLAAADRAVIDFVAINGRLPCPDSAGAGNEDCSAGVDKGWLPAATLGLDASAPARGVTRLRYVVYRYVDAADPTKSVDLAAGLDRFSPAHWDSYSLPSVAHVTSCTVPGSDDADPCFGPYNASPQVSVLDVCKGLNDAASTPSSATTAHIPGTAGAVVNVAYAIADGGTDRDGDGNVFDGALNPSSTPGLDAPTRSASADYDDRVIAHDFTELSGMLNCQTAMRSLDGLAQAVEISKEVHKQAESARLMAIIMSTVNAVKAAVQTAKLVMSGFALATAVSTLTAAAAQLASAIGTCFLLVGCAFIPTAAAAVASAAAGVVLAASAIALNAAAVAYHVTATVQTALVAQKAAAAVDPSTVDLASLLAQVQQASVDATAKAAASSAAATAARTAANTALTTYNQKVTDLRNRAHSFEFNPNYPNSNIDPGDAKLNTLINSYKTYADANAAFVVADGEYNRDLKKYNDAVASNEAARVDAVNNPTDPNKQSIYQQTLTPEGVKYLADLLQAKNQSATNRQSKLDLANTAKTAYNAALLAVNALYQHPGFNGAILVVVTLSESIDAMTNAYDTYLSKNIAAAEKEKSAVVDAKNATDSASALTALVAAIAAQQANGSAAAISVFQGGEAILKEADLRGGVK